MGGFDLFNLSPCAGQSGVSKGTMTYYDYERLNAVLCSTVAEKTLSQLAVHGLNIDPNRWASGRVSEDCSKVFVGCDAHFFPEWQAIRMRMFNSCASPGDSNGKKNNISSYHAAKMPPSGTFRHNMHHPK